MEAQTREQSLGNTKELKTLPISGKLVLAEHRLRDRIRKTKSRESKQTRNKAEEKNQIQQMSPHFKDAGTIASMPGHACSADQEKGDTKHLLIMHNLWEEKIRQIHLDRDRNLSEFGISAQKDRKIREKTHVPRERS
jgi:hypothetical protein